MCVHICTYNCILGARDAPQGDGRREGRNICLFETHDNDNDDYDNNKHTHKHENISMYTHSITL